MAKCINKSRKGAGYNTQASYKAIKFATPNIPCLILALVLLMLLTFLDVLYRFFLYNAKDRLQKCVSSCLLYDEVFSLVQAVLLNRDVKHLTCQPLLEWLILRKQVLR